MGEAEAEQKKLIELIQIKKQKEQDLCNFVKEQERRDAAEQAKLDKEKAFDTQKAMIEKLEQDKERLLRQNEELLQIYSSQKSQKSNENAVINLEEESEYSPSK